MVVETAQSAKDVEAAEPQANDPSLLQVLTLVIWLIWAAIGLVGLLGSHARSRPPQEAHPVPPLQAELVNVELTDEPPAEVADAAPSPAEDSEPPPPEADVPPLPAAALPSPAIAFAVPIDGPVQIVAPRQANLARVPINPRPVAQRITFGVGEGKQPAPEYPEQAQRQGQEGVVGIRFTVGPDGRVLSAEVSSPSPWPLLNQSALHTVRDQWRIPPGVNPVKEVFIRFKINQL